MKAMFGPTPIHKITMKMREHGESVRSWSERHGLKHQTVRNLIAGQYRNRRSPVCEEIRAKLLADGYLETEI